MRRKAFGLIGLILLNVALGGCAKCGGWDHFNAPWTPASCEDGAKLQK